MSDAASSAPQTPPGDSLAALRAIVDKPYLESVKYETQQFRANRQGAHLLIVEFEKYFRKRLEEMGIPTFTHCMVRTYEDQLKAYQGGFSTIHPDRGYPHQHCAIDRVHSKYGWNMTVDQWAILGHIGKEVAQMRGIDITWGGEGRFISKRWPHGDPAHWELTHWRERAKEVLR